MQTNNFLFLKKCKNTESAQLCINAEKVLLYPYIFFFNPFLPTGQFFAPKLIILIKCLIDILFFKVLF